MLKFLKTTVAEDVTTTDAARAEALVAEEVQVAADLKVHQHHVAKADSHQIVAQEAAMAEVHHVVKAVFLKAHHADQILHAELKELLTEHHADPKALTTRLVHAVHAKVNLLIFL